MTNTIICPHCDGNSFNYAERRTTERVRLSMEDNKLKVDGGIAKTPVIVAVCRTCDCEYDEHELREITEL